VRDDYGYASLAELYREWAERSQDADESAAYLRKAEETVAIGLRRTRVHDSLLIESSKIAKALGDKPASLAALKRAVDSATASVVARYLYGRALRYNGDFHAAAQVLEPIFLEDPYAFRAAIELALCNVALTGDFLKGAAILSQATLFGYKDATFIATLGGMQFLAKHIDDAKSTFEKGRRLPAEEQRKTRFAPHTRIGDLEFGNVRLTGTVSKVGVGFSYVLVPGYLDIFIGMSHLHGKRLVVGESISFEVVFSALGPRADVSTLRAV
jgi:tetratricopeptide (TPR) repeat protein